MDARCRRTEARSTIWGPSSARFLGCADLDVLRIRIVVLSEATIIEIESDSIFHADQHALIAADPQPTRAALSREFCRRIGWFKPDGGLKDMMARVTMLAMHRDGVIVLPPPKGRQYRPKPIVFGPDTEPPLFPPPTTLDELRPLEMRPVVRGTREGRLWNEFVARYHYRSGNHVSWGVIGLHNVSRLTITH